MTTLDHIEDIKLLDDFPIKNLHALNYHADGLHHLAQSVRSEEIKMYQLNKGKLAYQAVVLDNHNILMNISPYAPTQKYATITHSEKSTKEPS